jgi:glutaminase
MVNAGAIMTCSILVLNNKNIDDVMAFYKKATGAPVVEID